MKIVSSNIPDVLIIEPKVFGDDRGFFFESFNLHLFQEKIGLSPTFVQDNHSRSAKNVLRSLHYQIKQPQRKLVRVVAGEVFDIAVDIRKSSPSFGKWAGMVMSSENKRQMWIPPGFAHGCLVLSNSAECLYKSTDYYAPEHECGILRNDPDIDIDWPLTGEPILVAKDRLGKRFVEAVVFP